MVQVVLLLSFEAPQCDGAHLLQELKVLKFLCYGYPFIDYGAQISN